MYPLQKNRWVSPRVVRQLTRFTTQHEDLTLIQVQKLSL